ncbi:MAG TPA: hypothetical protein VJR47_05010 [Stellaceae bacterium]|nr:hypothetical protein [Stellaceae bacterium]
MPVSANLRRLIDANAPLWAGEAEIVRTYWTSPIRTRDTDKLWLRRQCWKEYVGVAMFPGETKDVCLATGLAATLREQVPQLDITIDRHDLRDEIEKVYAEFTHYCLFADIYDSLIEPGEPRINANQLTVWPEEDALAKFRAAIRKGGNARLARATGFTEGGYCTLYSEGAKLKGRPGIDGRIAAACQKVFDDEFGHMMYGVLGVDGQDMAAADWDEITDATCQILRLRLFMRNAQFSHPVPDQRMKEIFAGKIEPIAFDYARAEQYLAAHEEAAD